MIAKKIYQNVLRKYALILGKCDVFQIILKIHSLLCGPYYIIYSFNNNLLNLY